MKKRKDGRWQRSTTVNGKRIVFYSSEESEKKAIKDIERQMINYSESKERGKSFSEVAEEWQEEHFDKLEHYTERRYTTLLAHAITEFEDCYIKNITPKDIECFLLKFSIKGYSTKTIKDQFSILKMIFRYACIKGYIDSDITQYIKPPKGADPRKREALTDEEMKIVNSSIYCTLGLLAFFLMYSGLRKGEALALQWKDIDFKNNEINVYKSVCHHNNQPFIKSTKTESGTRKVMLLDCLSKELKKCPDKEKENYIFSGTTKPLTNSQFQCRWEKYNNETGLNITAHQLRHTFATILFEAEIDVKDAQHLMGHSDISVTQNIYTHVRQNRTAKTANKLNKFLSKNTAV